MCCRDLTRQWHAAATACNERGVEAVRPCPWVRAAAVDGICRILNTFWELVPAPTTAAFLAKLVDHLARDSAAPSVRAAVLEGLTRLVGNPLAQPVLKVGRCKLIHRTRVDGT